MSGYTRRDVLKAAGSVGIMVAASSPLSAFAKSSAIGKIDPTIHENATLKMKPIPAGTVIDANNYKNFPELEHFIPPSLFRRLKPGATRHDFPFPIKIMPTRKLSYDEADLKWINKNRGVVKLSSDHKKLLNWKAGLPFPEPKDIHEVSANYYKRRFNGDSYKVYLSLAIYDKQDRRKDAAFTYWQKPWSGRTLLPPVPEYPGGDIDWKGVSLFTKPYDASGFALLRHRYNDYDKPDDAWAYVPAIRRIRRYTGADVQDPLFGSDITMDDFAHFEQKIDYINIYPEKIEVGNNLVPGFFDTYADGNLVTSKKGRSLHVKGWEMRKCYKITYKIVDLNYMYSSRVMWIDAETFMPLFGEFYDQKGRLYRTWITTVAWLPDGTRCVPSAEMIDWINGSFTLLTLKTDPYNKIYPDNIFTLEFLKSGGR